MTDKQWQLIITQCRKAGDEHSRLLRIAEEEYERRYGNNPSEADDDWWIDTLHLCTGSIDIEGIKKSAEAHKEHKIKTW